ncbi:MAG: GGDEF domain-containing response regulator [Bacillota bacterium]
MARKFNILIVACDNKEEFYIENIISKLNVNILRVKNGNEALLKIYNENIDIVLFDADIPQMDSLDILETILTYERTKNISVVLITEKNRDEKYILKAYELGVADYIKKPINYKILRYKMTRLINTVKKGFKYERKYVMLKNKIEKLEDDIERLTKENNKEHSNIDSLTNLMKREKFEEILSNEWDRGLRNKYPISLLLVDVDYFEKYNDEYGHIQGDKCLKKIARIIDDNFNRATDFVARFKGEKFIVLIADFDYEEAKFVSDNLRESVEDANILHKKSPTNDYITISIGLATITPNYKYSSHDLIDEADSALYLAKKAGRNIVKGIKV